MKKVDLTIIIPIYNEEQIVPILMESLGKYLNKLTNISKEVIIVDDGSTDKTFDLLNKVKILSFDITLIKLAGNFGSHSAIRAGILYSRGKFVTILSADLQDPFEVVMKLYQKSREGFDIVLACREFGEKLTRRNIISRIYAMLIRKFVFPNFPINNFDNVMFNERVKKLLNQNIETNSSLFLQILSFGFKQSYVTYHKKERHSGKSKWTLAKKIKLFIDSFVAFSYIPIRIISIMGISLSLLGFTWAIYVVLRTILVRDIESGWPTLISVLMIGFGITNISLGIIAEYIWRTYDNSRGTKAFIIDKIKSSFK